MVCDHKTFYDDEVKLEESYAMAKAKANTLGTLAKRSYYGRWGRTGRAAWHRLKDSVFLTRTRVPLTASLA